MNNVSYTVSFLLTFALLLLPNHLYSQDKDLLARANLLQQKGVAYYSNDEYEKAIVYLKEAWDIKKQLGAESKDNVDILLLLGLCNYSISDYKEAIGFFQQSLSIQERTLGKGHSHNASILYFIAECYYWLSDYTNALKTHEQLLSIRESVIGKNHPDYAWSLYNIAECYYSLGDYTSALKYYEQSLSIIENVVGTENPDYAIMLYNISDCYISLGDYISALKYNERLLLVIESALGDEHPVYAKSFNNIGYCYYNLGDYTKALEYLEQSLSIQERVFGKNHPDYATTLENIGLCYNDLCNYTKALEYHEQALSIRERVLGKDHPDYAASLHNIGICYSDLGDYTKELENHEQALSIRERVLGKDHPDYAASLNSIGNSYSRLDDNAKALEYHEQALSIRERVLGKDHPDYAASLNNIGNCYSRLGDYAKALDFYEQALSIRERVFGKDHPDYAGSLNNIGHCYYNLGDYVKALEYHEQALSIRERVLGKDHPDYATSLNNMAICYSALSNYVKALEYHEQSLSIQERTHGKGHPDYSASLNNIGTCNFALGNYTKALEYCEQSLSIIERALGKAHPNYANSLFDMGICFFELGNDSEAVRYLSSYSSIASTIVTGSFSSMTEQQRASFWEKYDDFYTNLLFDYCVRLSSTLMNQTAYDGALLGKGLLLNAETEMRKLILESGDEDAVRMYDSIRESRIRLDRIYENPVGKKRQIDSLVADIEKREQSLTRRSTAFGDYTRNLSLKWTDVQAALGNKDIAIEFETYTRRDTTIYIALTLRKDYTEPHVVELFNSTQLSVRSDSRSYYTKTAMTELVWGNLSEDLEGVRNVYFSPAGELNNIGVEYMLDVDGRHLLSEKRNYYRLTSTRELVKSKDARRISDATIYGGIRFDVTPSSRLTGEETESERLKLAATRTVTPVGSPDLVRGECDYLPGTKAEAESVSSTLTSMKVKNELLTGASGTEESFKALSGARKDVIHIATHGFYWTESEAARMGNELGFISLSLDKSSVAPKEDKALTRSGLLFAGAKNSLEGKCIPVDVEDGILTAKDISRMDLRGTDLVVVSACQSGLGDVTGDGVFGLQRGFKKAGVKSIVMSLWSVDDTATKIMMTRFYENLAKGKSKYDAFREAQKYLRNYVDKETGRTFDRPEYYAAFVLLDAIN